MTSDSHNPRRHSGISRNHIIAAFRNQILVSVIFRNHIISVSRNQILVSVIYYISASTTPKYMHCSIKLIRKLLTPSHNEDLKSESHLFILMQSILHLPHPDFAIRASVQSHSKITMHTQTHIQPSS